MITTVREILDALEDIAPSRYAFASDKVGHQVGDINQTVSRVVVSMDPSLAAVDLGAEVGAQLLLTHHPLIFNPLVNLTFGTHQSRVLTALVKNDIGFIAAHTNWDSAKGGINDTLAGLFGLTPSEEFGHGAEVAFLKMVAYVPVGTEGAVIDAATNAGAGVIGAYRRCAFMNAGTGTFDADASAKPFVGAAGQSTQVDEIRLEMSLPAVKRAAVERVVRQMHPYEQPVIDFLQMAPVIEQRAGRICALDAPTSLGEFTQLVEATLGLPTWTWGAKSKPVLKVAFVGGAADGEWKAAQSAGADVLLTGEVKQHIALEASESGFALIAAGHYATEHPGTAALLQRMAASLPNVEWILYEPEPGTSGRPY